MNSATPGFPRIRRALACGRGTLFSLLAMVGVLQGQSLLTNSELKVAGSGAKSVAGWQLSPASTGLEAEFANLPEGVASALRVTVTEASSGSGALTQRLAIPAAAQKLVLTGHLKSDQPRGGYIEVKLYRGKTELARMNGGVLSAQHWQKVSINIDPHVTDKQGVAAVADKMEVLCRWYRQEKHIGGNVWFANVQLAEVAGTVAILGGSTATQAADGRKYGWGRMLAEFLRPGVVIENLALPEAAGGEEAVRRTWAACAATKPSYVLLQCDWDRSAGVAPEERAAQLSGAVKGHIRAAREAGVQLILVTPPVRRVFDEQGKLVDEFAGPAAVKDEGLPVVDLYGLSAGRLGTMGPEGSQALFSSLKDRANLSKDGARLMAALVVDSLAVQKPGSSALLNLAAAKGAL